MSLDISIIQRYSWEEFEQKLRSVSLLGDPDVKPYAQAEISSQVLSTNDFSPLAKYVLNSHLTMQEQLHESFQKNHNLNILDLDGGQPTVAFKVKSEKGIWLMSPPIVEESVGDANQLVLLDGEHRAYYARSIKQPVRAIVLKNVRRDCPVVAFPLRWQDVKRFDEVPSLAEKRNFRFPDFRDFPDISGFSDATITQDNFNYFFYRDLSPICSSGVRPAKSA